MKTVGVVVPVYNERENLAALLSRLRATAAKRQDLVWRFIFVNDGSADGSREILDAAAAEGDDVVVIHLSRNFGHQAAVTAGIDHADDDVVCLIDADMQDPPELLVDMIGEIEAGHDIVYGQRTQREGESWLKRATAGAFYRILRALTRVDIPPDTGDFRVMRKPVVDVLRSMREYHRFIRGMVAWTGFRAKAFPYTRHARTAGETKYPLGRMIRFAMDAIFSFSDVPLRLASYVGIFTAILGLGGMVYIVFKWVVFDQFARGFTTTVCVFLIIAGVQLMFLGVIGQYLGRLFEQAKGRPLYIVAERRNADGATGGKEGSAR